MPGAFLQIEGPVNRAIKVEQEVDTEIAMIVKNLETFPADAADIEVNDKLVHDALEQRQIPAAAADLFDFGVGKGFGAEAVAIGGSQVLRVFRRVRPVGPIDGTESAFDT